MKCIKNNFCFFVGIKSKRDHFLTQEHIYELVADVEVLEKIPEGLNGEKA